MIMATTKEITSDSPQTYVTAFSELDGKIQNLEIKKDSIEHTLKDYEHIFKIMAEENDELRRENSLLRHSSSILKQDYLFNPGPEGKGSNLASIKSSLLSLSQKISGGDFKNVIAQINRHVKEIDFIESVYDRNVEDKNKIIEHLESENCVLKETLAEKDYKIEELDNLVSDKEMKIIELANVSESCRDGLVNELKVRIVSLEEELAVKAQELDSKKNVADKPGLEIVGKNKEILELQGKLKELEKAEASMIRDLEELKLNLEIKNEEILSLKKDLEDQQKKSNFNAATVESVKKLQSELKLKSDEVDHLTKGLSDKTADVEKLSAELVDKAQVFEELRNAVERKTSELSVVKELEIELNNALKGKEESYNELKYQYESLQSKTELLNSMISAKDELLKTKEFTLENQKQEISDLSSRNKDLLAKFESVDKTSGSNVIIEELNHTIASLKKNIEIERLQMQNKLNYEETRFAESLDVAKVLEKKLQIAAAEYDELSDNYELLKKESDLKDKRLEAAIEKTETFKNQLRKAKTILKNFVSINESIFEGVRNFPNIIIPAAKYMSPKQVVQLNFDDTESMIKKTSEDINSVVDFVPVLKRSIFEFAETNKLLLQSLSSNQLRDQFLKFQTTIGALIEEFLDSNDAEKSNIFSTLSTLFQKFADLDGEVSQKIASFNLSLVNLEKVGKHFEEINFALLELHEKNEMLMLDNGELECRISELQQKLSVLEKSKIDVEESLKQETLIRQQLEEKNSLLENSITLSKEALMKKLDDSNETIKKKEVEISGLIEHKNDLSHKIERISEEFSLLQKEKQCLLADKSSLKNQVDSLIQKIDGMQGSFDAMGSSLNDMKLNCEQKNMLLNEKELKIQSTENELVMKDSKLADLNTQIDGLNDKVKTLNIDLASFEEKLNQKVKENEILNENIKENLKMLKNEEQSNKELTLKIDHLFEEKAELLSKLVASESKDATSQAEILKLIEKIQADEIALVKSEEEVNTLKSIISQKETEAVSLKKDIAELGQLIDENGIKLDELEIIRSSLLKKDEELSELRIKSDEMKFKATLLQEELENKKVELNIVHLQFENHKKEAEETLSQKNEDLSNIKKTLEDAMWNADRKGTDLIKLKEKLSQLDQDKEQAISELRSSLHGALEEVKVAEEILQHKETEMAAEKVRLQEVINSKESSLKDLQANLAQLQEVYESKQIEKDSVISILEGKVNETEQELLTVSDKLNIAMERNNIQENELRENLSLLNQRENEVNKLRKVLEENGLKIKSLELTMEVLLSEIKLKDSSITDLNANLQPYYSTLSAHENNISEQEKSIADLKQQIESREKELAALTEEKDSEINELTNELNELRSGKTMSELDLSDYKVKLEQLKVELEESKQSCGGHEDTIDNLKSKLLELEVDRNQKQDTINVLKNESDGYFKELDLQLKKTSTLVNELDAVKVELKELRASAARIAEERDDIGSQYDMIKMERDSMESALKEKDAEIDVLHKNYSETKKLIDDYAVCNKSLEDTLKIYEQNLSSKSKEIETNFRYRQEAKSDYEKATKEIFEAVKEMLKMFDISIDCEMPQCIKLLKETVQDRLEMNKGEIVILGIELDQQKKLIKEKEGHVQKLLRELEIISERYGTVKDQFEEEMKQVKDLSDHQEANIKELENMNEELRAAVAHGQHKLEMTLMELRDAKVSSNTAKKKLTQDHYVQTSPDEEMVKLKKQLKKYELSRQYYKKKITEFEQQLADSCEIISQLEQQLSRKDLFNSKQSLDENQNGNKLISEQQLKKIVQAYENRLSKLYILIKKGDEGLDKGGELPIFGV